MCHEGSAHEGQSIAFQLPAEEPQNSSLMGICLPEFFAIDFAAIILGSEENKFDPTRILVDGKVGLDELFQLVAELVLRDYASLRVGLLPRTSDELLLYQPPGHAPLELIA